jgi:sialic acid synthase SpsE
MFTKDNIWVKRPGTGSIRAEHFDRTTRKNCRIEILTMMKHIDWE